MSSRYTIQALRRRHRLFGKEIQYRTSEFQKFATERPRAEEELRRSREELRTLAVRLQAVREKERARLAREIHDELSGSLTALKMDLSLLPDRAPGAQFVSGKTNVHVCAD